MVLVLLLCIQEYRLVLGLLIKLDIYVTSAVNITNMAAFFTRCPHFQYNKEQFYILGITHALSCKLRDFFFPRCMEHITSAILRTNGI